LVLRLVLDILLENDKLLVLRALVEFNRDANSFTKSTISNNSSRVFWRGGDKGLNKAGVFL
jgi:hypothetical protein